MKNLRKTLPLAVLASAFMAAPAFAATDLTSMVTGLKTQMQSLGQLAGLVAFLAGFVFGIMGFMKLKANAQNPQDPSNKVSTAFMLIFIGAGLIAVPAVMGIGVQSLFGSKDKTTNLNDGGGFTTLK